LHNFEYFEPKTLSEATSLLKEHASKAKVLAGGTDLIIQMEDKLVRPEYVINLKRIPGLEDIGTNGSGVRIGALTKMREIQKSSLIIQKYPALAEAAGEVGSVQIRNLATLGGNVCNASPAGDTLPALLALDATVKIAGPSGERTIPIREFFLGPRKTVLADGEIVMSFFLPTPPPHSGSKYIKLTIRRLMDLAFVGVAAAVTMDGKACKDVKIALGAVAPTVIRATNAENILKGKTLTDELLTRAGEAATQESKPISDLRASAEYRREMVAVLTRRAVKAAAEIAINKSA
jgi:carbon-monoxide dehydrogenase medium subunit